MTTPSDPDEIAKQAREHAWNWFALHATQRMQAFNFFVVATAFLIAAYASILEKHPGAAAVLAAVGAWLTLWFNRLDARSCQRSTRCRRRVSRVSQITRTLKFSMLWTTPALALLLIAW